MATLRERITAPAHLELPTAVGGLTFRAASREDLDAVHELAVAAAAVDDPRSRPSTADFERTLSTEGLDVARDTLVGMDAEGHVQAYGIVIDVPSRVTAARVVLDGAVQPGLRGQGIGRRIMGWQIGRARQRLATLELDVPASIEIGAPEGAASLRLAAHFGMQPTRNWIDMQVVFGLGAEDDPSLPPLPEGYVVRAATPDDIEPLRTAKNDAFRDHWGSQPMVESDWRGFLTATKSRLDLSRVVLGPDGAIAAFAIVEVDPDGFAARGRSYGYVHWVGVVRAARGLGLAPIVLGASLQAIRAEGLSAAVLHVDAENPSGAGRIYERLGFVGGEVEVTASMPL